LVWLNVNIAQILYALVQAMQAACHVFLLQEPGDSSDWQSENAKEEINKLLVCFGEEDSTALCVYQKLQRYLGSCHFSISMLKRFQSS
jgi:hypothetical protein